MNIEEINYLRDPRTQGPAKKPTLSFYGCGTCGTPGEACDCPAAPDGVDPVNGVHFYGTDIEEDLPTRWAVCPVCDGRGSHVNPSIDASGISREQMDEDPDFAEQYWHGTYDQICTRCSGRTTVQEVDWDALTTDQRKAYEQQLHEEAGDRACHLAELAAGA